MRKKIILEIEPPLDEYISVVFATPKFDHFRLDVDVPVRMNGDESPLDLWICRASKITVHPNSIFPQIMRRVVP